MKIYFCEGCGKRVTDRDLESGKARDKQLAGVYCTACAQGVTTQTELPVAHKQESKVSDRKPKLARHSGAKITPASPAVRPFKRPAQSAAAGWDLRMVVLVSAGVVLLLIGGVLVFRPSSAPQYLKREKASAQRLPGVEHPKGELPLKRSSGHSTVAPSPPPDGSQAASIPRPSALRPQEPIAKGENTDDDPKAIVKEGGAAATPESNAKTPAPSEPPAVAAEKPNAVEPSADSGETYADFREAFLAFLSEGKLARAETRLSQAEEDPVLAEFTAAMVFERKALGWARDLKEAVASGVMKLNEVERFELRMAKGFPVQVGAATGSRVKEFKDGKIRVASDKIELEMHVDSLDEETLKKLTDLGLGRDANGHVRRAFAELLRNLRGRSERKAMRTELESARARGANEEETAYLERLLAEALPAANETGATGTLTKAGSPLDKGLVAHWGLDQPGGNTVPNDLGGNLSGRLVNMGASAWVKGGASGAGYSLHFDGIDDYVEVPHAEALNPFPMTVALWVKPSKVASGFCLANKYRNGSYDGWFLIYRPPGTLTLLYGGGTQNNLSEGPTGVAAGALEPDRWQHVAMCVDTSGMRVYVNGQERASRTWPNAPKASSNSNPLLFGRYDAGSPWLLSGQLDDIRLYNRALQAEEVQTLVNKAQSDTRQVLAWGLEQTPIEDLSKNRRDGKIVGPVDIVDGVQKRAMRFDAKDEYATLPHDAALNVFPLSVSVWVRLRNGGGQYGALASKYDSDARNGWAIVWDQKVLKGFFGCDNHHRMTKRALFGGLEMEKWHHVVFIVDEQGGRLIVDGKAGKTQPWTGRSGACTTTADFTLSRFAGQDGTWLDGDLDELHIYEGVLSHAEIEALGKP